MLDQLAAELGAVGSSVHRTWSSSTPRPSCTGRPAAVPTALRRRAPRTTDAHLPGAVFADLVTELSGPAYDFALPTSGAVRGGRRRARDRPGHARVVVYAQQEPMWATRLWWLLRYHGFDDVAVLDGGLGAWTAAGLPVTAEPVAPAVRRTFVPEPYGRSCSPEPGGRRGGRSQSGGACLVNSLAGPGLPRRGCHVVLTTRDGSPTSTNTPWQDLLDPRTGRFLPGRPSSVARTRRRCSSPRRRSRCTAEPASPRPSSCSPSPCSDATTSGCTTGHSPSGRPTRDLPLEVG